MYQFFVNSIVVLSLFITFISSLNAQEFPIILRNAEVCLRRAQNSNDFNVADSAIALYEQVLNKYKDNSYYMAVANTGIAMALFIKGQKDPNCNSNGLKYSRSAIELENNHAPAHKIQGILHSKVGNHDLAKIDFINSINYGLFDEEVAEYFSNALFALKQCDDLGIMANEDIIVTLRTYCYLNRIPIKIKNNNFLQAQNDLSYIKNNLSKIHDEFRNDLEDKINSLEQKLLEKLLDSIEKSPDNPNWNDALKRLMPDCSTDIEKFIIALKKRDEPDLSSAKIYLQETLSSNCNNKLFKLFKNRVRHLYDEIVEIKIDSCALIQQYYKDGKFEQAIKLLTTDPNLVKCPINFDTTSTLDSVWCIKFTELFLEYNGLRTSLKYHLRQLTNSDSAIFLIAVADSRNENILSEKIISNFFQILKRNPLFKPFYFKKKSDIPARYYMAQAYDKASDSELSTFKMEALIVTGKSLCESILAINPEHQGAKDLRDNLNSKLRSLRAVACIKTAWKHGFLTFVFFIVLIACLIFRWIRYKLETTRWIKEYLLKNPVIDIMKLEKIQLKKLVLFLDDYIIPSEENNEEKKFSESNRVIDEILQDFTIKYAKSLFMILASWCEEGKLPLPALDDEEKIISENVIRYKKFTFSKCISISPKEWFLQEFECSRYGIEIENNKVLIVKLPLIKGESNDKR